MDSKSIQIQTWKDVKRKIISLNPTMGSEIDQIPGVDSFPVLKVQYPYGAPIIRKGLFYLNFDGDFINYKNSAIPHEIRELLNYTWLGIPFGVVTHNSFESHVDIPSHTIPQRLLTPGDAFSLMTIFEKQGSSHHMVGAQSATAGCRSLITLPSIAHYQYNERLSKRYHFDETVCPKDLAGQWELFKELSNAKSFRSNWHCELIFFSEAFVSALNQQTKLKEFLLSSAWNATSFMRHSALYDLVFSTFVEDCLPLSAKNSAPVIETVKHILKLALRQVPGYSPCTTEVAGPITGYTKALIDVYRIRYFWPIFMQVAPFDGNKPIYYSLQKHTFLHTIPQKNTSNNKTIRELIVIKNIIELFREKVLSHELPISLKSTALYKMLKDVEFDFYHPHADETGIINDIDSIAHDDKRFMKIVSKFPNEKNYVFPVKSIFFNGCIRVRPINN